MTAALPDYTVASRQPEAGAFAQFFGGKEGFEYTGLDAIQHATTGISEGQLYVLSGSHLG